MWRKRKKGEIYSDRERGRERERGGKGKRERYLNIERVREKRIE